MGELFPPTGMNDAQAMVMLPSREGSAANQAASDEHYEDSHLLQGSASNQGATDEHQDSQSSHDSASNQGASDKQENSPWPPPVVSPYWPLGPNRDRTRLLKIEPAEHVTHGIVCTLSEVAFFDRPKFDALSYMWGEGPACRQITLNGIQYNVRQNLWDALHFLRSHNTERLYWIDAICINQDNISERNRQVKMMHHIYFRAQCVIVWLGRYSRYFSPRRSNISSTSENSMFSAPAESLSEEERTQRRYLANELSKDGYWNRLWIIQEISRGHNIKVCFGVYYMDWNSFKIFITGNASMPEAPLRLYKLREGKYAESSTLIHLLQEHKDALCQDRKDKVYGLVGLASDARGFPVDYGRSEFEIWMDTMEFLNRNDLFGGKDIVAVGALVKFLLMGAEGSLTDYTHLLALPEENQEEIITDHNDPKSFNLQAAVLGRVIWVGPEAHEIVGNLDKVDEWMDKIQENFKDDLGNAHRESDTLLHDILDMDDESLSKKCFDCKCSIQWTPPENTISSLTGPWGKTDLSEWNADVNKLNEDEWFGTKIDESEVTEEVPISTNNTASAWNLTLTPLAGQGQQQQQQQPFCRSRMFQIKGRHHNEPGPHKMGLASSDISAGDLVCWFEWPRRGVVVRRGAVLISSGRKKAKKKTKIPTKSLQVVGTAVVAEDLRQEYLGRSQREDWAKNRPMINVYLDARTLFVVLCD